MSDRELLELAAKAAGIRINAGKQAERDDAGFGDVGLWTTETTTWNPLTYDGDALHLAVKLQINVLHDHNIPAHYAEWNAADGIDDGVSEFESGDVDEYAATRRAIVRAAAEIGRGMP